MFLSQGYVHSEVSGPPDSISVPGRLLASNGVEYSCSMTMESSLFVEVDSRGIDTKFAIGEMVTCNIQHIGIVSGFISEFTSSGFVFDVQMNAVRHARIDARLNWLKLRTNDTPEQRRNQRITPVSTGVIIRTPQGGEFKGEISDLSMSGAAINSSIQPNIGSDVTVGKRISNVVRHMENGFAVQFKLPFNFETFNENVVL